MPERAWNEWPSMDDGAEEVASKLALALEVQSQKSWTRDRRDQAKADALAAWYAYLEKVYGPQD